MREIKGCSHCPALSMPCMVHFFVMVACCVPLVQVTLDTLKFDRSRAQTCGVWTPKAPGDTGYSGVISSPGDRTAAAPVWWVVVHKLSKGVTQAAVASIPLPAGYTATAF